MRILHAMFSKGLGGIERAFITMDQVLRVEGHDVLNVVQPGTPIINELPATAAWEPIANRGQWDPLAWARLARCIRRHKPDALVSHGRRAAAILHRANGLNAAMPGGARVPHATLLHRYSFSYLRPFDRVICVSADLVRRAEEAGVPKGRAVLVPNMLGGHARAAAECVDASATVVIGFIGRFVANKGIDVLLQTMDLLARRGCPVRLLIGGSGPLEQELKAHAAALDATPDITFLGWIDDQTAFFEQIDILCVPSRWEPFGIVVLEGWYHKRPVVAAAAIGPSEVMTDAQDGLLVPVEDPAGLADALQAAVQDPALRKRLVQGGTQSLQCYTPTQVGPRLDQVLADMVSDCALETKK